MFDFFLKIGSNNRIKNPYQNGNEFYNNKRFKLYESKTNEFHFTGLYRENKQYDIFENSDYFSGIVGNVFYKIEYQDRCKGQINAQKILDNILSSNNFFSKIKGNFTIIFYNKQIKKLRIINDQFALKPCYHSVINNDFIVTNNLNHLKMFNLRVNEVAVLEKLLFTYPLGEETFFKGVYQLGGGKILEYANAKFNIKKYFNLEAFVFKDHRIKFDIIKYIEEFNNSVVQKSKLSKNVICSLTGGYDGRSIVSTLLKYNISFNTYSFGREGGENTVVPLDIQRKIGLNYKPIILEKEYEKHYSQFAQEAIYFSDGLSLHERSNYMYAFNELSKNSEYVLTGLLGGETLGPVHLRTDYINQFYYDVIYSKKNICIKRYLEEKGLLGYIKEGFLERNIQEIHLHIEKRKKEIQRLKSKRDGYLYYYYDLMDLGYKRFYGSEIHMERFYAENLPPFYDIDLLELLLGSNYIKIFKNAFTDSVFSRRNGRKVQAHIIFENYPELSKIPVDRGFPPIYLLHPLKKLLIPYLYFKRKKRLEKLNPEFTSNIWSSIIYDSFKNKKLQNFNIFNERAINSFMKHYKSEKYNQEFNLLFGIYLWLNLKDNYYKKI